MAKFCNTLRSTLRAWHQPATYLGAAIIAAIWISFTFHLAVERDRLQLGSVKNSSNLARVFEEHIVGILKETDRTLLLLRSAYLDGPLDFDLTKWLANPALHTSLILHIAIVDANGVMTSSSLEPVTSIFNVSDRTYFRVQRERSEDELFISEPTLGRIVGKRVIILSRGIRAPRHQRLL